MEKGFGCAHSATDTLYTWPEYGELIGAWFNGHPWTQEVSIRVEDPDHPIVRALAPSFRIADEIYQFRDFSRDRVHVLLSLDTSSVDLRRPESIGTTEISRWHGVAITARAGYFTRHWAIPTTPGTTSVFNPCS